MLREKLQSDLCRTSLPTRYRYLGCSSLAVVLLSAPQSLRADIFRSAVVRRNGQNHILKARTIVAATGGFKANIEWLRESWDAAADNFRIRGTPYNRGSPIKVTLSKGVKQFRAMRLQSKLAHQNLMGYRHTTRLYFTGLRQTLPAC